MNESSAVGADYTERFTEYYRRIGFPVQVVDNTLWLEENRMIHPLVPACEPSVVTQSEAKLLLAKSSKAILVRCTDGFPAETAPLKWYAVICRKFLELSQCNSKNRSQIKKGLERCKVEKVDAEHVARFGYELHVAAMARYAKGLDIRAQSADKFRNDVLIAKDFQDVMDFWAVYHEGIMVGSSLVYRLGNVEAAYSAIAYHPDYFKTCFPSHALIHTMNEHYLQDRSFQYVNNGYRSVWHPTGFQQFLVEHFCFEHAYTNLYVRYKPLVSAVLALPSPAKRLVARFSSKFAALCRLDELRTADRD